MKSRMENADFDKKTRTRIINSQNMMKQTIANRHIINTFTPIENRKRLKTQQSCRIRTKLGRFHIIDIVRFKRRM